MMHRKRFNKEIGRIKSVRDCMHVRTIVRGRSGLYRYIRERVEPGGNVDIKRVRNPICLAQKIEIFENIFRESS
eukprot:287606-Amorphochlora_amoeboformis.AAC.1